MVNLHGEDDTIEPITGQAEEYGNTGCKTHPSVTRRLQSLTILSQMPRLTSMHGGKLGPGATDAPIRLATGL